MTKIDPHPAISPDAGEQQDRAETFARQLHWGQKELDGQPYIGHIERVVALVQTDDEKTVAWLHDVLEDTPTTANDLVRAGFSDAIVEAVKLLSRDPLDSYADYIDTIHGMGNLVPLAKAVKVADLRDHLRPNCPERLRPRYERALNLLTALPAHQERTEPTTLEVIVNGQPVVVTAGTVRAVIEQAIQLSGQIGAPVAQWELRTTEGDIIPHDLSDGTDYELTPGRRLWLNLGAPVLPRTEAAPARAAEWQPLTTKEKIHTLVAEIRRCVGDDHLFSAVIHRKLDAIDAELTEPLPPCALTGNSK